MSSSNCENLSEDWTLLKFDGSNYYYNSEETKKKEENCAEEEE